MASTSKRIVSVKEMGTVLGKCGPRSSLQERGVKKSDEFEAHIVSKSRPESLTFPCDPDLQHARGQEISEHPTRRVLETRSRMGHRWGGRTKAKPCSNSEPPGVPQTVG